MKFYYLEVEEKDWNEVINNITKVIPIWNEKFDISLPIKHIGFYIDLKNEFGLNNDNLLLFRYHKLNFKNCDYIKCKDIEEFLFSYESSKMGLL